MRDTQNIQINKVIGENETCIFFFILQKKPYGLFVQPNTYLQRNSPYMTKEIIYKNVFFRLFIIARKLQAI